MATPTTYVRAPDGTIGTIPAEHLRAALGDGFTAVSPEEFARASRPAPTTSDELLAGGLGVVQGATFGAGVPAALQATEWAAGPETREALRTRLQQAKEGSPYLYGSGEAVGMLAPLLMTGGTSAVASAVRGAGAISRGVAGAGRLAEQAATRLVGREAESLAGQAIQRTLPTALRAATEGAAYGAGHEVSEASLGDYDLTAERLMASAGYSALLAGGLGASLSLTGMAAQRALQKAAPTLADMAEQTALRATGARTADVRRIFNSMGEDGAGAVGRRAMNDLSEVAGKPFSRMTVDEVQEVAQAARKETGAKIGEFYTGLDSAGVSTRPNPGVIRERIEREVIAPIAKTPGMRNVATGVRDYLDEFAEQTTGRNWAGRFAKDESVSFANLHKFRMGLDDMIKWEGKPTLLTENMRKVRGILDEELKSSGQKAATEIGFPQWGEELGKLGEKYRHFKEIERISSAEAARSAAANVFSFGDQLVGIGGLVTGNPIMGAMGAVARKVVRERGAFWGAEILDKLAALGGVRRAADKASRQFEDVVTGFFRRMDEPAIRGEAIASVHAQDRPAVPIDTRYDRAVAHVTEYAANPAALSARLAQSAGAIAHVAPNVAASVASQAMRATQFLQSKIPPGQLPSGSLTPHLEKPRVSPAQKQKFMRYVDAVEKPAEALRQMQHGKLMPETVETLRALYPRTYAELQSHVATRLAGLKKPPSYATKLQLRLLLGVSTDPTLTPEFITAMQATYATSSRPEGGSMPRRPLAITPHVQTHMQRLEER